MDQKPVTCKNCKGRIPKKRAEWATMHGRVAVYCSDDCSAKARSREQWERKKKGSA